jgi:hypothetical protein
MNTHQTSSSTRSRNNIIDKYHKNRSSSMNSLHLSTNSLTSSLNQTEMLASPKKGSKQKTPNNAKPTKIKSFDYSECKSLSNSNNNNNKRDSSTDKKRYNFFFFLFINCHLIFYKLSLLLLEVEAK